MRTLGSNSAIIGFCIGLFVGLVVLSSDTDNYRNRGCPTTTNGNEGLSGGSSSEFIAATPSTVLKANYGTKKDQTRFKRPRYFYTELGLRKKLSLNVLMTEKDETEYVIALNATAAENVDKFSIFIGGNAADQHVPIELKKLGFKNVVDLRQLKNFIDSNLIPSKQQQPPVEKYETVVRLLGYLKSSKMPNNYDYFAFVPAKSYLNVKSLLELVRKTSVSQDVAWGNVDGKKCDVDHGFLLSSRLVKNFGAKTELCYMNLALDLPDHFAKCLEMIYLNFPCTVIPIGNSSTSTNNGFINRVDSPEVIYNLHRQSLTTNHQNLHSEVKKLQDGIRLAYPKVPAKFQKELNSWPIGYSEAPLPKTRFDVEKWTFLRQNLKFDGCSTTSASYIHGVDALDVQQILNSTLAFIQTETGQNTTVFQISSLYRRFDPVRGMEYLIDLENTATKKSTRVQALKALSKMELMPVPYVTENKKVYILVPVMFEPVVAIKSFLDRYFDCKIDKKSNTVLILLFLSPTIDNLQPSDQHVPNPADIETIKNLINRYNTNVGKGSLSTEPPKASYILVPRSNSKSFNPFLAGIDAVIKRIVGSDSIMFTADLSVTFEDAFLNRIRISAIKGWQAFSPVPFVQYHPSIVATSANATLTVSNNQGYFNPSFWQYFGFHSSDYLQARRTLNATFQATLNSPKDFGVLQKLFLHQLPHLHILRAPDPNFRLRRQYLDNNSQPNSTQSCLFIKCGNKNHLSRYIFGDTFQNL